MKMVWLAVVADSGTVISSIRTGLTGALATRNLLVMCGWQQRRFRRNIRTAGLEFGHAGLARSGARRKDRPGLRAWQRRGGDRHPAAAPHRSQPLASTATPRSVRCIRREPRRDRAASPDMALQ